MSLGTRPWRQHTEPVRSQLCPGCWHPGAAPQHRQARCYPGMPGHSWNPTQLHPYLPRAPGPMGLTKTNVPGTALSQTGPTVLCWPPAWQGKGKTLPWGATPVPGDPWTHAAHVHCLGKSVAGMAQDPGSGYVPQRCSAASSFPGTGVRGKAFLQSPVTLWGSPFPKPQFPILPLSSSGNMTGGLLVRRQQGRALPISLPAPACSGCCCPLLLPRSNAAGCPVSPVLLLQDGLFSSRILSPGSIPPPHSPLKSAALSMPRLGHCWDQGQLQGQPGTSLVLSPPHGHILP